MRVAVAGASGFLGHALVEELRGAAHTVVAIGRGGGKTRPDIVWDPARRQIDARALDGVDVIVNLAGANIGQRWTPSAKREILASRIDSTSLLATTAATMSPPPRLFLAGSAVGYYGHEGEAERDETSPKGRGFLAEVAAAWEGAAEPARRAGIRVVHARSGLVLSPRGGVLARLLPPFRFGAGGKIASGRQWMSWISLVDWVRGMRHLAESEEPGGVVNVTSPHPVRNDEFTQALARVLHRPAIATVPAIALKVAFGSEMPEETLLGGQRAVPHRLLREGFVFELPKLEQALAAELARR